MTAPTACYELRRGIIQSELALARQLVAVGVQTGEQPVLAGSDVGAVLGELAVAPLQDLSAELVPHRGSGHRSARPALPGSCDLALKSRHPPVEVRDVVW